MSEVDFGRWVAGVGGDADVPCDGCTACCESGYFVHVEPDEVETIARIPKELLFPAPGKPRGHLVLANDADGRCPMLVDGACSIYEHRPRTCRTFDCRVLAAAGVEPEERQVALRRAVGRWRFTYETDDDRAHHEAVEAAARDLQDEEHHPLGLALRAVAAGMRAR